MIIKTQRKILNWQVTFILCLTLCFIQLSHAANLTIVNPNKFYFSNPPVWLTSPFFRAGNQNVISTKTGNSSTPTWPFIFSSALTGIPNLAYGIKNYRGDDTLREQYFQIRKISLTTTSFEVLIQISGFTNVWLLNVAYLAVEPIFPHHFNTFDNVPLNYSSGPLYNITSKSSSLQYFTEYINYTQQAAGKTHSTFATPLTTNNIVLFITSYFSVATGVVTPANPIRFHIYSQVLNSSFYLLNATIQVQCYVSRLHFSQIFFDSDDIQRSQRYYVVYQKWYNDVNGGWIQIPFAFVDNFIMGVTSFQTIDGSCGFEYQWNFANDTNNTFGIKMEVSITKKSACGFSWSQSSILYIQTWRCDPPYNYFNVSTSLCQTLCGGFTIQNSTSLKCQPCNNSNCYQCNQNDTNVCLECATYLNFELINNTCVCPQGYFQTATSCILCSNISIGCLNCTYSSNLANLPFNASFFQCDICNQTSNYFLNNSLCVHCSLTDCSDCLNLTACSICSNNKTLSDILTCVNCYVPGCATCLSTDPNTCFYLCGDNIIDPVQGCDDGNLVNFDGCSSLCKIQVTLSLSYISKITEKCNQLQFQLKFNKHYPFMNSIDYNAALMCSHSHLINRRNQYNQGTLKLSFSYDSNMQNQRVTFSFNQSLLANHTLYIFIEDTSLTNFLVLPYNNIAASFLDESQCSQKQTIKTITNIIEKGSYALLLLSALPAKIVGLQLFGVLQLAFISLGSIDQVNEMLAPLMSIKAVNGLSLPFLHSQNQNLPQRVKGIDYFPSFLDNFNVMLLVLIAELVLAFIIYAICSIFSTKTSCFYQVAKRLLKQVLLTLILFNSFNIAYSTAIHFRYTANSFLELSSIAAIATGILILCMAAAIIFTNEEGFGQFKDKFGKDPIQSNYLAVTIIYRFILGFLLGWNNEDDLSTMFGVGINLLFLIYFLVNLPFTKAYHNYRAGLCHGVNFITLFVSMYYRSMTSNVSPQQTAYIFSPAYLQIYLILCCLIISLIVLCYDIFLYLKYFTCNQSKIDSNHSEVVSFQNIIINNTQVTEQNIDFKPIISLNAQI